MRYVGSKVGGVSSLGLPQMAPPRYRLATGPLRSAVIGSNKYVKYHSCILPRCQVHHGEGSGLDKEAGGQPTNAMTPVDFNAIVKGKAAKNEDKAENVGEQEKKTDALGENYKKLRKAAIHLAQENGDMDDILYTMEEVLETVVQDVEGVKAWQERHGCQGDDTGYAAKFRVDHYFPSEARAAAGTVGSAREPRSGGGESRPTSPYLLVCRHSEGNGKVRWRAYPTKHHFGISGTSFHTSHSEKHCAWVIILALIYKGGPQYAEKILRNHKNGYQLYFDETDTLMTKEDFLAGEIMLSQEEEEEIMRKIREMIP